MFFHDFSESFLYFFEIQPIELRNPKLVIKKKKCGSGPHLCDPTLWLIISFSSDRLDLSVFGLTDS